MLQKRDIGIDYLSILHNILDKKRKQKKKKSKHKPQPTSIQSLSLSLSVSLSLILSVYLSLFCVYIYIYIHSPLLFFISEAKWPFFYTCPKGNCVNRVSSASAVTEQ